MNTIQDKERSTGNKRQLLLIFNYQYFGDFTVEQLRIL